MSEQRKPRFGQDFRPGYLFGEQSALPVSRLLRDSRQAMGMKLRAFRARDETGQWGFFQTPLKMYARSNGFKGMNFHKHLLRKLKEAKRAGVKLRVLDIGVGAGNQWAQAAQHPSLELWGTSLSGVRRSGFPGKLRVCSAASLHKKFKEGYFDLVVSHKGLHGMERPGVENVVWLLKPGGEAILTSDFFTDFPADNSINSKEAARHFKVVDYQSGELKEGGWLLRLRKNGPFKSGGIFGKSVEWPISGWKRLGGKGFLKSVRAARAKDELVDFLGDGIAGWAYWGTGLKDYSALPNFDFEHFLKERLNQAAQKSEKLSVLDVGVGHGGQWQGLLDHPALELEATSLSKTVDNSLKGKVKLATAAKLYRHFAPNRFDIVVSNMGMHGMELSGIENAMHLLKPDGELILTADAPLKKFKLALERAKENYQVVASNSFATKAGPIWSVRLRKK